MYNASQPIWKLPAEVLLAIFQYCDDFDPVTSMHGYLAWLPILHVCRLWYFLGVQCPMLWQTVCSSRGKDCVFEVLFRSCGLPLRIVIPSVNRHTIDAAILLLHAIPRAKSIRMHVPSLYDLTIANVTHRIPGPLPLLENLTMDVTGPYADDARLELPTFFPQELPNLRELRVTANCHFAKMLAAPALEVLQIETEYAHCDEEEWQIDTMDFLDSIRAMPRLRHLTVAGHLPAFEDEFDFHRNIPEVVLPSLDALYLQGPSWLYTWLCNALIIPADARVALSYELEMDMDVDLLIPSIARLFTRSTPDGRTRARALRAIALSGAEGQLVFEGSSFHRDILHPAVLHESEKKADFWLCVCYNEPHVPGAPKFDGLRRLMAGLPLSAVETVNIVGCKAKEMLVPDCLIDAFLRHMNFAGPLEDITPQCLEVRQNDEESMDVDEPWRKILPSLRRICFEPTTAWRHD